MVIALWILGGLALLVLGLVGFLSIMHGTPVERVQASYDMDEIPDPGDDRFLELMALHTRTAFHPGHEITVTTNGDETYEPLWRDLESAEQSLTVQLYYCHMGKMAERCGEILRDRARAGVQVLFLMDAIGAGFSKDFIDSLCEAGVRVAKFRPIKWYQLHKAQNRSHIRVIVVDGKVAWTGGFGLDDKWYGDGRHEDQWRDTNVRFTGPAVRALQATFAAGWAEATGTLLSGDHFFQAGEPLDESGGAVAGLLHAAPTIGSTAAERMLALSIAAARQRLYISNSYFVPDAAFRRLLCDAAKRGVDVRVMTPGEKCDVKITWYAGHAGHEELLSSGVRIFEYQPVMMHAKSLVADGCWVSAGTLNFDNRSLAYNDESNLLILDETIGQRMEEIFKEDLEYCRELKLETFRRRALHQRLLERGATSIARLL